MGAVKNHFFDEINAQPDPVFVRDEPPAFTVQPTYAGAPAVFYRGIYRTAEECRLLLKVFREDAAGSDYFAAHAARLADELESAIREAAEQQNRRVM